MRFHLLAGLEGEDVQALGLESVPRPGDDPGRDAVQLEDDAVVQRTDRPVGADLRGPPMP
jgi:hypothetical protein